MKEKMVYFFGKDMAEGKADMKNLLGGKGANLSEMALINLPVPPGFTLTTEVCLYYADNNGKYPDNFREQVNENMKKLQQLMERDFGSNSNPLLVSVRSGAPVSMPGMMDTILNLGLNDQTVKGLSSMTGNERFAYDSYRRFIQMYGSVVMKIDHGKFEEILSSIKKKNNVSIDIELNAESFKEIVRLYKELVTKETGMEFPSDVNEQLWGAMEAVFKSWNNERAIEYRRIENIPDNLGTAVNIQAMVYGNLGEDSATGVAFTRNPSNGDNHFYGEYLINAQGEDVVAGIRTPQPINESSKMQDEQKTLEELMPEMYNELYSIRTKLENHYADMQDLEFTIEKGKLWILQTRTGKRTPNAAIKIAVDFVKEKIIDKETAVLRVTPANIDGMLHPMIDPDEKITVIAKGLPASPGAASGRIVLSAKKAVEKAKNEIDLILVREETSPEDIAGMNICNGI
ncbi:pyruvate, phosphate dikinase, partial [candidate division WOR-3 bacterium]|nr:pyruvate, phosphate dikinase [candidate division WOR-3 bacterium]